MKYKFYNLLILVLILTTLFSTTINPIAVNQNIVYGEEVVVRQGDTVTVPIKISKNSGLMGFRITVEFPDFLIEPTVERGDLTQVGFFNDSITDEMKTKFDVLWSYTDEISGDGILFVLKFKVAEKATDKSQKIKVSYSQEDTFDGEFRNVELNCEDIDITIESYKQEVTFWQKILLFFKYVYNFLVGLFR